MQNIHKRWWFWAVVAIVVLGVLNSVNSGSHPSSNSPIVEESPIASACQGFSPHATHPINYKELTKSPDTFTSNQSTFTGQVLQIQESGGSGFMRLAVDKDSFGNWNSNDVVLVDYQGHSDAVTDDVVTVAGVMKGSETYTSEANFQITVPLMYACTISKSGAKSSSASATGGVGHTVEPSSSTQSVQNTSGLTASQQDTPLTGTPTSTTVAPPPASWHTIATFSGATQKNTSSFVIQGSQWRITWQETGDGYFGADAESPDRSSLCSIASLIGSGSDSTYCYQPGTYYLSINTSNPWTMTVEDYY